MRDKIKKFLWMWFLTTVAVGLSFAFSIGVLMTGLLLIETMGYELKTAVTLYDSLRFMATGFIFGVIIAFGLWPMTCIVDYLTGSKRRRR